MPRDTRGRYSPPNDSGDKMSHYPPGSKGLANLLAAGYGMTVEDARQIIKEREENPHTHPYEVYRNAKALLEAFMAKVAVIDTEPGFQRYADEDNV